MSVQAGAETEYEKRHNPIWPELERVLKDYGVLNLLDLPAHRDSPIWPELEKGAQRPRRLELLDLPAHRDSPVFRLRRSRERGRVGARWLNGGVPRLLATHGRC